VDSSAPLPNKKGASQKGKGGRDEKASRGTPPVSKSPRGEKDVTVGTTAGDHPAAPKKPSGTLKPTAKGTGDVSGPLSVAPTGTTPTTAQVDKVVPSRERRNKTPVYVSGVKDTR
jgi:hypothetical protein